MTAPTPDCLARVATRDAWRSGAFGHGADLDPDQLAAYHDAALEQHRAAIRAMPPGLVPVETLLATVRDVTTGPAERHARAPWTERDESSARSCSTPRTRSALIAGVRR